MPAFHTRACVALLVALAVGGCASRGAAPAAAALAPEPRSTILAENEGRDWLDVYLVHELGEWYLGRLAPGARAMLPLPAALDARPAGMVRLVALAGTARSTRPSRDPRAVVTVAQPITAMLGQRWTFAQGQLTGHRPHPRERR